MVKMSLNKANIKVSNFRSFIFYKKLYFERGLDSLIPEMIGLVMKDT